MSTVPYKGEDWPVSDAWAERHLAGEFAQIPARTTEAMWDRLWAILRTSDETLSERTAGLSHDQVAGLMRDPERAKAIIETLSPEDLRELRAVEAHIIVRNRVDHLLGRNLSEFDIHYIDHAHGQGAVPSCGCDLLTVLDDDKLARTHAGEEGLQFSHPHYPRKLCGQHAHLQAVVDALGRWHNAPLADRLAHVHETIHADQEAQPEAAAAA